MARADQSGARTRRLKPGHTYLDLDHPDRGVFVATGDEVVDPGANIVDQEDVSGDGWQSLVAGGWGEFKPGAGDRAYDSGAFGQENDPRSDTLNAAPPGVGERLTPHEGGEERRR